MTRLYEVSARNRSGWGPKREAGSVHLPPAGDQRKLVVLIHGFATSVAKANKSYHSFISHLSDAGGGRHPSSTSYVTFHWAGNHRVPGLNQLTYSSRVDAAHISGQRLAEAIYASDWDEIVLTAHSLGSRVALEAMRHLSHLRGKEGDSRPRVTVAILMAAAVPASECISPDGFARGKLDCGRYVVLHSYLDAVLELAFRPGQFLYGENWDRAVGRMGEPAERWDRSERMYFGHGRYWAEMEPAYVVAEELGSRVSLRIPATAPPASPGLPELVLPILDPVI